MAGIKSTTGLLPPNHDRLLSSQPQQTNKQFRFSKTKSFVTTYLLPASTVPYTERWAGALSSAERQQLLWDRHGHTAAAGGHRDPLTYYNTT